MNSIRKYIHFVLLTTSSLGLLKMFSVTPFNRLAGDEFGYAAVVKNAGLLQAQRSQYINWSGRYTSTFFQSTLPLLFKNNGNIFIFSLFTFVLLFSAFAVFYKALLNRDLKNTEILLLSAVSMPLLYLITPNKEESFYWLSGAVTYLWPIITGLFVASLLLEQKLSKKGLLVLSVLSLFQAGFNETFGFLVVLVSGVLLVINYLSFLKPKKISLGIFNINLVRKIERKYILFFIFSVLGFLIMFFAPGNNVRGNSAASDKMNILGAITYSIQSGSSLLYSIFQENFLLLTFFWFISAVFIAELLNNSRSKGEDMEKYAVWTVLSLTAPVILSIFYLIPSYSVLGRLPPDRSDITLSAILLVSIIFSSYYLGKVFIILKYSRNIRFQILVAGVALVMFLASFKLVNTLGGDIYIARDYAIAYDQTYQILLQAKKEKSTETVVLPVLPESGLIHSAQVTGNRYHWYNNAVADFFDLEGGVVSE